MLILIIVWIGILGVLMALIGTQRIRYSVGLPLAYFLGLSLIHVPGATLYMNIEDAGLIAGWSQRGFELTVIGMVGFLGGVILARYGAFARRRLGRENREKPQGLSTDDIKGLNRRALIYLVVGCFSYFVLLPTLGGIATVTAVIASLGSLIIVGAILRLWAAAESGNRSQFWSTIALLPVLPLSTMVLSGFLGFGVYWVLAIASFLFAQSNRRWGYFLLTPAVLYVGISIFVTYMGGRSEIRQVVWEQRATIVDKFERVAEVFENFQWFDLQNVKHRGAIDGRLNQNWLIGVAADRLESGQVDYALGRTLGDVLVGLIPRAFWPDKPQVGGGGRGSVVEEYTGFEWKGATSVGAGQVLEFYVNYGIFGVVGGFLLWGWLLGRMDAWIVEHFHSGDHARLLVLFLVCVAMLQPGGNLLEIVVSAASSAITGYGINYVLNWRRGKFRVRTV